MQYAPITMKKGSLERPRCARDNAAYEARGRTAAAQVKRRPMTTEERNELLAQLERLRQEHRDLDTAIEALQGSPGKDLIQVQRLKKRKLVLRDKIGFIEDQLTPDITA